MSRLAQTCCQLTKMSEWLIKNPDLDGRIGRLVERGSLQKSNANDLKKKDYNTCLDYLFDVLLRSKRIELNGWWSSKNQKYVDNASIFLFLFNRKPFHWVSSEPFFLSLFLILSVFAFVAMMTDRDNETDDISTRWCPDIDDCVRKIVFMARSPFDLWRF